MELHNSVLLWFVRRLVQEEDLVEVLQRGVSPPEPESFLVTEGDGITQHCQVPRPLGGLRPPSSSGSCSRPVPGDTESVVDGYYYLFLSRFTCRNSEPGN